MENRIKIVSRKDANVITHSGEFHADDVFAVAILSFLKEIKLTRTRDIGVPNDDTIIVDVGGRYDGKRYFDHHQGLIRRKNGGNFASAGLIWMHYGKEILEKNNLQFKNEVFEVVDELMSKIDADDNGETETESEISKLISEFNPNIVHDLSSYDSCFIEAVMFARKIIENKIKTVESKYREYEEIKKEMEITKGNTVFLKKYYPNWCENILEIDEKHKIDYCVYPYIDESVHIVCIPPDRRKKFEQRKSMPKEWAGLSGEELEQAIGIEGAIFCHLKQFFMAVNSLETAIKVIEKLNQI
jgi:hypothetical protein